ncbi:MAG: hypothetical protein V7459_11355 [Oceanicoccus sp.]
MDPQKQSNWIQMVTGVTVLIGLGLVVWELQQTRDIARAQITHDSYALIIEDSRAMLSESFGDVFAKGCIDPSTLTDGEIVQLREYYDANLFLIRRLRDVTESGGFDYSWELIAKGFVRHWLDSKVGRLHYNHMVKIGLEPELQNLAKDFLEIELVNPCGNLENFSEKVRAVETE